MRERKIRLLGRYDFEDGGYVEISIGGDVDTDTAIEMVEELLKIKREELTRRAALKALDAHGGAER